MSEVTAELPPPQKEEEEMKEDSEVEADKPKDDGEDIDTTNKDETKSQKIEEKKEIFKKEKKEAKKKEEEEEVESDEEEEESSPRVGILEMPVVLEKGAKRERKKVERLEFQSPTESSKFEIAEGKGTALGDIPFIDFKINRTKAEELKPLHRVLYRKMGSNNDCKKNIRKFSGFWFTKDDDEFKKRHDILMQLKFKLSVLKNICEVLDVKRQGTKEEIVNRLLEFLMKPKDSGKKVPKPKRKRQSKGKGEKAGKKQKKTKSKAKTESDQDDDDEEEEEEDEEEESDEEKPPKKKARKEPVKKEKKKDIKKKEVKDKSIKKESKTQKKATPKKKKEEVSDISDISDSDEDSDDEPLIKKTGPPTNDELKDLIKKMLDTANLEEVTMKTVLKDVYAKYPNYDLSDRKDFIKNTVKQIIS